MEFPWACGCGSRWATKYILKIVCAYEFANKTRENKIIRRVKLLGGDIEAFIYLKIKFLLTVFSTALLIF
jgi:hypothetical protein